MCVIPLLNKEHLSKLDSFKRGASTRLKDSGVVAPTPSKRTV